MRFYPFSQEYCNIEMKKASATGGTNNKSIDSGYYDVVLNGANRKTVAYFGKYQQQTTQSQQLQNDQFPDKSKDPEKTEMSHRNQINHDMRYRDLETEDIDDDQLNGEEEIELEENEYDPDSYVQQEQENCVLISDSDEEGNPQVRFAPYSYTIRIVKSL